MTDDTTGDAQDAPDTTDTRSTGETPPPWERDGTEFDPAKAWRLIENLRAELGEVKKNPPAAADTAPATEAEPDGDATDLAARLSALETQLAAERAAVTRERVARRHDLPDAIVSLLGDGDDTALSKRAESLIAWADSRGTEATKPRRPARSRGTYPDTPPESTDPAKLAAAVLGQ